MGRERPGRDVMLERLARLKLYVVEIASAIVFIVFVMVAAVREIRHLLEMLK